MTRHFDVRDIHYVPYIEVSRTSTFNPITLPYLRRCTIVNGDNRKWSSHLPRIKPVAKCRVSMSISPFVVQLGRYCLLLIGCLIICSPNWIVCTEAFAYKYCFVYIGDSIENATPHRLIPTQSCSSIAILLNALLPTVAKLLNIEWH